MAAKTPDATDPGTVGGVSSVTTGQRHLRLPFITENIDDADTYAASGDVSITRVAWEPVNATDLVAAVLTNAQLVTFASTGDNHTGYLHVWMNG